MDQYITDIDVSLDETEEQKLQLQGFSKIDVDLNKGTGGNSIYLWYKKESGSERITRLQVTFNDDMAAGLKQAKYTKIPKDLNTGAGGDHIYLWYFRGSGEYDTPILEIDVTTDAVNEPQRFCNDWERLACSLNRGTAGNSIHAWVKRDNTYICDVTATDSYGSDTSYFQKGYIRMDEDTNGGEGGAFVFIWYRQTTDSQRALTDLQISTNESERKDLEQKHYQLVSVNLNEGTGGNQVYLWHKKEGVNHPIKAITLLHNQDAVDLYKRAGATVIDRNLNTGWQGHTEYLCVNQWKPEEASSRQQS